MRLEWCKELQQQTALVNLTTLLKMQNGLYLDLSHLETYNTYVSFIHQFWYGL